MMPDPGNLLSWIEQALLIASVGALLPIGLRIRHPRTQLAYCHVLLATCLALPFIQPWKHPLVRIGSASSPAQSVPTTAVRSASKLPASAPQRNDKVNLPGPAPPPSLWAQLFASHLLLWILAAGAAARIGFLLIGLWQIRRRRIAATPLYPIPESVQAATAITHANAVFCISDDTPGPVMLGWLTPVVLLPQSFPALGDEAQCGIACHELLHVRRNDWMVTLLEELAGALLWFNPGVWLLLSQARLAREQLVDAEVVRLTAARESYIEALLAIARARPGLDLAPAPLFLRRRLLTQRMHSLLSEVGMSRFRLFSSYSCIAAALVFAGWFAFSSFPLIGSPRFEEVADAAADAPDPQLPVTALPQPAIVSVPSQLRAPFVTLPETPRRRGPSVPIPADPYEPVMWGVQAASTPAEKAAAIELLLRATENSRMHNPTMFPYFLKASFVANGNVSHTGSGELTETWLSGRKWRWTATLGGYSLARIGSGQVGFDEKRESFIPARVQMLRDAIFWAARSPTATLAIRTASAQVSGKPVTCILTSRMPDPGTQARLWEEEEHCVDPASGVLQLYSVAPGTYAVYGYGKNLRFHGRIVPDQITVYTGGLVALEAQVSLTDAGMVDDSLLRPTPEMIAGGTALMLITAQRFAIDIPHSSVSGAARPVIVHATIDPEGKVIEAELSSASDPGLAALALDLVKQRNFGEGVFAQRDAYINVRFVPAQQ